jgi:protein-S-isoprenylcysteine O-methyltransferase Ste14
MRKSMTLGGIGPKLALLCLPYIMLSLIVMYRYPEFFDLKFLNSNSVKIIGSVWSGAGFIFWITAAIFFLKHFKPGKLITTGTFALCRNPIYSSIIVFMIPGLALIFHSGLIFSISLVLYIGFRISIHGESHILKDIFGEEYVKYEMSVNKILPFPRFLLKGKTIRQ